MIVLKSQLQGYYLLSGKVFCQAAVCRMLGLMESECMMVVSIPNMTRQEEGTILYILCAEYGYLFIKML